MTTTEICARTTDLEAILRWRETYRSEMACQIIHDSIHRRANWTEEYVLCLDGIGVGYGSIAVGGPWMGKPTVYEFYVVPEHRFHVFDFFRALIDVSGAIAIEIQSNDVLATVMVHTFARGVTSQSILFHDRLTTAHAPPRAIFREATAAEFPDLPDDQLRWRGVVEVDDQVAATGGILFHYNPPYGDIFMDVAEPYRRRGLGSFLVQELKRVCHEGGHVPAARCNPENVASRRTLQKAGFVPCGHVLSGPIAQ